MKQGTNMNARRLFRHFGTMAAAALACLLMVGGTAGVAFARGGDFHGGGGFHGGFRGGGFHGGFRGGGFHGGFRGGGFRGGGFRGPQIRGGYGYRGFGYRGFGYRGFGGYGYGWGWDPWWGVGLGLYLPVLPWYYSTFWWDGVPYYYGDNGYYLWDSDVGQYEQVQPPSQVVQQAQAGELTQTPPELFAYPKNGQTAQQQAADKRECSTWASSQTGFYPAAGAAPAPATPAGKAGHAGANAAQDAPANTPQPSSAQQQQNYLRAEGACLQARGYSVD
jgi:hypothetical protein